LEVGADNSSDEAGEQTMVKNAAEPVERSAWTKRNSLKPPVTMTQNMGQTDRGLSRIRKAAKQNTAAFSYQIVSSRSLLRRFSSAVTS